MALDVERSPVLIGVGQRVQRDVDPREALDPVALMLDATARAAEDAGIPVGALAELDRVVVPSVIGSRYANAARLVAQKLGAAGAEPRYPGVGGNGPQKQINAAARDIAAGRADFVLLTGAEALDTRQRARKAGVELDWSGGGAPDGAEPEPPPSSEVETRHRLFLPPFVYPLHETALRAALGQDPETHRRALGEMLARASEVAAGNPHAWFRTRRDADEITRPGPGNRMVAFPYTKYMNAILRVDQSAAVLLTSVARARALGVHPDRLVHWLGGGDAVEEPWFLSERPSFVESNGMQRAFAAAFAESGLRVEDVHAFDLYSCFPSAVQLACRTLGIGIDDRRPLTVTGGLAYAGGPGNDYGTHAVARLVERLRADAGAVGMVTGIGWFFTKHSAGLYSTLPPMDLTAEESAPPPAPTPKSVPVAMEPSGRGWIEAYTVVHGRDGSAERGIVVGRLEDDRRFVAFVEDDEETLRSLEETEGVGRRGRVRTDGGSNRMALD